MFTYLYPNFELWFFFFFSLARKLKDKKKISVFFIFVHNYLQKLQWDLNDFHLPEERNVSRAGFTDILNLICPH